MSDDILNQGCVYKFLSNFYFLPSSPAYGIDLRLCCLSSVPCIEQGREEVYRRLCYLCTVPRPSYPGPPPSPLPPAPDILKTKNKQTENKNLTSLDASAWCVVNTENLMRLRHCVIWSVYSVFSSKMALMLPITTARNTGRSGGAFLHRWFWCHIVPLHHASASTYCAGVLQLAGWNHEWTWQRMRTKCGYTHVHPGACEMTLNPFWGWKVKSNCRKKIIYSLRMKKREKICSEWLDAMCT